MWYKQFTYKKQDFKRHREDETREYADIRCDYIVSMTSGLNFDVKKWYVSNN